MTVTALILAGGKATRLGGIAKHELVIDGETIFARQVRVLAPRVAEIIVSGAEVAGYRTVLDAVDGAGPLAGIAAGLAAATTPWLLVIAGDMPYLTGELIDAMVALAHADDGDVDAVGVRSAGLPEPLLAVLSPRMLPLVERRLGARRWKASGLLTDEGARVRWLDDPDPRALVNINSPADLRE
jgi:molybdopterin-guanine dinucleotide biosynthesis protein A